MSRGLDRFHPQGLRGVEGSYSDVPLEFWVEEHRHWTMSTLVALSIVQALHAVKYSGMQQELGDPFLQIAVVMSFAAVGSCIPSIGLLKRFPAQVDASLVDRVTVMMYCLQLAFVSVRAVVSKQSPISQVVFSALVCAVGGLRPGSALLLSIFGSIVVSISLLIQGALHKDVLAYCALVAAWPLNIAGYVLALRRMKEVPMRWLLMEKVSEEIRVQYRLLHEVCDCLFWLSEDADSVVRCDSRLDDLPGDNMKGRSLADAMATMEDTVKLRTAIATATRNSPTSLIVSVNTNQGKVMEAQLFILRKNSSDSLFADQEEPLSGIVVGLKKMRSAAEACNKINDDKSSCPTMRTEVIFQSNNIMSAQSDSFRQSVEKIVALARKEHWFLEYDRLVIPKQCEVLGHGGFGVVIAARLEGTDAAVKVPHQAACAGIEWGPALNELRILRHLRHPNIVLFFGAVVAAETCTLAIVFERVFGQMLEEFIKVGASGPSNSHRLSLMKDCCAALRYMHGQSPAIMHGDLKPANIMVEDTAKRPRLKLLDFGLSRITSPSAAPPGGTFRWMAPEVLLTPTKKPKLAADVYSFGCIAFFTFTGQAPFRFSPAPKLRELVKNNVAPFDWSETEMTHLLSYLRPAIEACLWRDEDARPSMKDVGHTFEKYRPEPGYDYGGPSSEANVFKEAGAANNVGSLNNFTLKREKREDGPAGHPLVPLGQLQQSLPPPGERDKSEEQVQPAVQTQIPVSAPVQEEVQLPPPPHATGEKALSPEDVVKVLQEDYEDVKKRAPKLIAVWFDLESFSILHASQAFVEIAGDAVAHSLFEYLVDSRQFKACCKRLVDDARTSANPALRGESRKRQSVEELCNVSVRPASKLYAAMGSPARTRCSISVVAAVAVPPEKFLTVLRVKLLTSACDTDREQQMVCL
eukprot:TRINITY_DN71475_c0_g1_i3.p1 TRINITY_DN71475_c0_g1~~TRINITY_DN71475_c0_g1_i3.p1  ORF type:complete len:920 (+),score=216.02 TRINITY_DN71475_c0_g1_i3:100-2859(+)